MDIKELKINDVFEFRYNQEFIQNNFEPYHCFDGTLVVKQYDTGELYLQDTYWSGYESKKFTFQEACQQGTLEFLCNAEGMKEIKEYEMVNYDDNDIVILRIHAGYRNKILIKSETKRSQAKMTQSLESKIKECEIEIESAKYSIKRHNENLEKVKQGDLSIYI